jgi:pterin-4a-carbinolamine dehydratase
MSNWKEGNGKEIVQKHIHTQKYNQSIEFMARYTNEENIVIFVTVSPEPHTRYLF